MLEDWQGDADSSAGDFSLNFSIVGENPTMATGETGADESMYTPVHDNTYPTETAKKGKLIKTLTSIAVGATRIATTTDVKILR